MSSIVLMRYLFGIVTFVFASIGLCACSSLSPFPNSNGLANPKELVRSEHASDIWSYLRKDFHLPEESPNNPAVLRQINWYLSSPKAFQQIIEQSRPYLFYIYCQVRKRRLPAELTLLPVVESSFNPFDYSHAGAAGLWQIMPGTAWVMA